jgi:hypothetical protein
VSSIVIGLLNDDDDDNDGYLVNEGRIFVIQYAISMKILHYITHYILHCFIVLSALEKEEERRRKE